MNILSAAITLVISLLMILVFRQTDKNNRSIEKAKKYGDRLKEELNAFVAERNQALRDGAIELEAKLSQAIATVNRLDSIHKEFMKKSDVLTARSAAIEKIEKTVSDAEKTIHTVMDMTALAEKNLARVSKESDFVETLAKKIADARTELAYISKMMPEMQETFRKQNEDHLVSIRDNITAGFDAAMNGFENRVAAAQKKSEELLEVTSIQLNDLYKKAFTEAAKKAEKMEDDLFINLKSEATDRMEKFASSVNDKTAQLEDRLQSTVSDTLMQVDKYRKDWQAEADTLKASMETKYSTAEAALFKQMAGLEEELARAESDIQNRQADIDGNITALETALAQKLETTSYQTERQVAVLAQSADEKFTEYKKKADYFYEKFEKNLANIDLLADEMDKTQESIKDRMMQDFGKHVYTMQEKYNTFEKHFANRSDHLSNRIEEITKQLNQLRDDSYTHLSEKLQVFEKEFLSELTRKSDALSADIEKLRNDAAERLTLMGSENESARKDLEDRYKQELKQRLIHAQEEYKAYFVKFKEEVNAFEQSVTAQIKETGKTLADYTGQFKSQIDQTKERALGIIQKEVGGLRLTVQDAVKQQTQEVANVLKAAQTSVETVKQDSADKLQAFEADFTAWKNSIADQIAGTRTLVDEKIAQYSEITDRAIENIGGKYNAQYKDFIIKGDESLKVMQHKLNELHTKIIAADEQVAGKVQEVTDNLTKHADQLTGTLDKKITDATEEAAHSLDSIRAVVYNLRTEVDQTQHDMLEKIRQNTDNLANVVSEIDKKQNAFIAQTRVFDRADELKAALEQDIEKLKGEVTRFEIYRNAMDDLNLQYEKVTHLEEEAMQKIARFMGERKNIDILENEFAKLTVLSDSMDKKIVELAATNDDLQRYQVQIRRIEESITDVNTRYDRLEKKGVVLDQTVQSIDAAFENLKAIEKDVKNLQTKVYDLPPELKTIEEKMEYLIQHQEQAEKVRQQLETIDDLLADMEVRIEKMHNAREWLAGTETRLQDISKTSENQLKLLSDLLKNEKPTLKGEGGGTNSAPAIGTRENVLKLFRSGWKREAIANALNLSQGEVELILELAEK